MELRNRLLAQEHLQRLEHPAHGQRHVDEELALQQLWVCCGEGLNCGFGGGADVWVHAEEGDGVVVVHLGCAVGVVVVCGGLGVPGWELGWERDGDGGEVERAEGELHEGCAPLEEPRIRLALAEAVDG